jgi:hypothetical protein
MILEKIVNGLTVTHHTSLDGRQRLHAIKVRGRKTDDGNASVRIGPEPGAISANRRILAQGLCSSDIVLTGYCGTSLVAAHEVEGVPVIYHGGSSGLWCNNSITELVGEAGVVAVVVAETGTVGSPIHNFCRVVIIHYM